MHILGKIKQYEGVRELRGDLLEVVTVYSASFGKWQKSRPEDGLNRCVLGAHFENTSLGDHGTNTPRQCKVLFMITISENLKAIGEKLGNIA